MKNFKIALKDNCEIFNKVVQNSQPRLSNNSSKKTKLKSLKKNQSKDNNDSLVQIRSLSQGKESIFQSINSSKKNNLIKRQISRPLEEQSVDEKYNVQPPLSTLGILSMEKRRRQYERSIKSEEKQLGQYKPQQTFIMEQDIREKSLMAVKNFFCIKGDLSNGSLIDKSILSQISYKPLAPERQGNFQMQILGKQEAAKCSFLEEISGGKVVIFKKNNLCKPFFLTNKNNTNNKSALVKGINYSAAQTEKIPSKQNEIIQERLQQILLPPFSIDKKKVKYLHDTPERSPSKQESQSQLPQNKQQVKNIFQFQEMQQESKVEDKPIKSAYLPNNNQIMLSNQFNHFQLFKERPTSEELRPQSYKELNSKILHFKPAKIQNSPSKLSYKILNILPQETSSSDTSSSVTAFCNNFQYDQSNYSNLNFNQEDNSYNYNSKQNNNSSFNSGNQSRSRTPKLYKIDFQSRQKIVNAENIFVNNPTNKESKRAGCSSALYKFKKHISAKKEK